MKRAILFSLLGGYVLGKVGNEIFGGKTARKIYVEAATGAFILKDSIMARAEKIQAGAMDIAVDAKAKVEQYYAEKERAYTEGVDPVVQAEEVKEEV